MNYIAIKDLKTPKILREKLETEQELLLTNNGKPMALLLHVGEEGPETVLKAVRDARSRMALTVIRDAAKASGAAGLSQQEIDSLISRTRKTRRASR